MTYDELRDNPLNFASLVAHQLQSPLNAVSAALQAVLSEYAGPLLPQQRGPLERANARCDEAITTIRRMLSLARAAHAGAMQAAATDLVAAIRAAQVRFGPEAYARGIRVEFSLPGTPAFVRMDAPALAEILNALLSNAVKYTPDHGRVEIAVTAPPAPAPVVLAVSDSGIGIPEAEAARIFEPFYRTRASKDTAKGIGLGLAFVRGMVVAAGGTIAIDRAPLGGARFSVTLPHAAKAPESESAPARPRLRVVVIGGVTAGPKAAARILRQQPDAEVTIVDRGTVLSYAGCGLPFYVSGVVKDQKRLVSSPAGVMRDPVFFRSIKSVRVMNQTEALEIDRTGRRVRVRDLPTGDETWLPYDKLVLACGARAIIPAALQTSLRNVFTLHGVRDAEGIKAALAEMQARDVVIVGGGLVGIEMTEALALRGARVTIIEQAERILQILDPDLSLLLERHLEAHGVRVVTGCRALRLDGDDRVRSVETTCGPLPAGLVILAVGVSPETTLARATGLTLGAGGAIAVDAGQQTSDPDIYAAGDCCATTHRVTGKPCYIPLGSTASKQGRVVAINVCGGSARFPGVLGTSACRVFDYSVVRTGLGEDDARQAGFDAESVIVAGPDRTHFMPDARPIVLKLVAERGTGRILGLQGVGPGTLDKRLDVAAVTIGAGATLDDLAHADLGYSPSFSADLDNIITAANVLRNKLDGNLKTVRAGELRARLQAREPILLGDVRTPAEFEQGHLPGAVSMPLGSLRGRLPDIPPGRGVVLYCDQGLRSYEASLILRNAGVTDTRVLEGGLLAWPHPLVEG